MSLATSPGLHRAWPGFYGSHLPLGRTPESWIFRDPKLVPVFPETIPPTLVLIIPGPDCRQGGLLLMEGGNCGSLPSPGRGC